LKPTQVPQFLMYYISSWFVFVNVQTFKRKVYNQYPITFGYLLVGRQAVRIENIVIIILVITVSCFRKTKKYHPILKCIKYKLI